MEMLGRYERTTALTNQNAGSCVWCFGIRGGHEYFIKEFLSPKYPANDTVSSPEKIARKMAECEAFERVKTHTYQKINEHSDGNAVHIEEFFRVGTKYYMAMPRIRGLKLTVSEIAARSDKQKLCAIIAHAVAGLHRGHFVHADIKHSNILFTRPSPSALTAKLIDYDAGFFEDTPPTHPEEVAGDQVYLSPEAWLRIMGEETALTCKLDVFALGVLFHQYMTGLLPLYDGEKFGCVGEAVACGDTVTVSDAMPEEVHDLLMQMLDADPEQRPDAREVFRILSGQAAKKNAADETMTRDPLGEAGWVSLSEL